MPDPSSPAKIRRMLSQPLISTYRLHFPSLPVVCLSQAPNPCRASPVTRYIVFTKKFPSQLISSPLRVGEDRSTSFSRTDADIEILGISPRPPSALGVE